MPTPLTAAFAGLPDPRSDRGQKHRLADILAIAVCAVIAGADSWEEVERFGQAKLPWLKTFLTLPNGIPSHDTFYRLFARLDPDAFGRCVTAWLAGCLPGHRADARGGGRQGRAVVPEGHVQRPCLHLVSAWAAEGRLILRPGVGGRRVARDRRHAPNC